MVEPTERPELYDFLLISGVVRDDDGVAEAFLGIIDGDLEAARVSDDTGGPDAALETWFKLMDCGIMDMRFIRLVSVGLMVLAPSPVA